MGVATYRRCEQLSALLPALLAQVGALADPAEVVVIDNDPAGGAAAVVAGLGGSPVRYVHEPRPGLAAARNRALAEAADADALVFIDDDEVPGQRWLEHLVDAWKAWGCAAVAGPVRASFAQPPSGWVLASGSFDRRRRQSGQAVSGAATNNLLIDMNCVRALRLEFREQFGLTGGEDTMFVHELMHRGGEIRWCDEAEVVEPVAPERMTRRWVLRRAFRAGTTWSAMELGLAGSASRRGLTRLSLTARSIVRLTRAAVVMVCAMHPAGLDQRARNCVEFVSCAGMLLGAFGLRFHEYSRK